MMLDKIQRRSYELEHIDTGDYTPRNTKSCIGELQLVNRWMGDARSLERTLFVTDDCARSAAELFRA